jgi:hypothetical protein
VAYNRSDYRHKWRIERQAAAVRRHLKLDQLEPLSPFQLADAVPAHVFYPQDFGNPRLPTVHVASIGTGSRSAATQTRR